MTKALLERMILEETKNLSADTLHEILDFIKFKKQKTFGKKSFEKNMETELSDLNEMSLIHLEEEFSNYKELYPREH
ncbi:MAG: hypothetical protein ACE5IY_10380 [bacterium]